MVWAARRAYRDYPTVVNDVPELGSTSYRNDLADYAAMDYKLQTSQKAIGGSSDTAQLSQSYYYNDIIHKVWTEDTKQYYDNTVILAVLAQVAIDSAKRMFDISVIDEIQRIRAQDCMNRDKDFPKFMKYTHKISSTKNGQKLDYDVLAMKRKKVDKRIDNEIVCPMTWLEDCIDKIQGTRSSPSETIDTIDFLVDQLDITKVSKKQLLQIEDILIQYDSDFRASFISSDKSEMNFDDGLLLVGEMTDAVFEKIRNMHLTLPAMYELVKAIIKCEAHGTMDLTNKKFINPTARSLSVLYNAERERFLSCFKRANGSIVSR